MLTNDKAWRMGIRDGVPIALGYFAVAFTLGIAAKNAGFTALQAMVVSATNLASAGQYAGFTMVRTAATYVEMAVMIFVANARYLLMSSALSQKFHKDTPFIHRLGVAYGVTDEIFGICVGTEGKLNPRYAYGAMLVAIPGWSIGTYLGVLMGNILPDRVVSALSVGLYGMFIAIIFPAARKNRLILGLIIISMLSSAIFEFAPVVSQIPAGTRIIILTVIISAVAACLFPVKGDPYNGDNSATDE